MKLWIMILTLMGTCFASETFVTSEKPKVILSGSTKIELGPRSKAILKDSYVQLLKGVMEMNTEKFNAKLENVTFVPNKAHLSLALEGSDIILNVHSGEVEISSPHIHSFVPVIVKAKEGWGYSLKEKSFSQKEYREIKKP